MPEVTETRTLRAFKGEYDTIAAYDVDDIRRWYVDDQKMIGNDEFDPHTWEPLPNDAPLSIHWEPDDWETLANKPADCDVNEEPDIPGRVLVTATVAAWLASHGRGLLCSTEW